MEKISFLRKSFKRIKNWEKEEREVAKGRAKILISWKLSKPKSEPKKFLKKLGNEKALIKRRQRNKFKITPKIVTKAGILVSCIA